MILDRRSLGLEIPSENHWSSKYWSDNVVAQRDDLKTREAQWPTLASQYARRYAAGESIRKIAEDAGRSFGFVHGVLKEAGVELRGRGGATRGVKKAASTSAAKKATTPAKKSAARKAPATAAKKAPAKKTTAKKAPARKR